MSDHERIAKLEAKLDAVSGDLDAALLVMSIVLTKAEISPIGDNVLKSLKIALHDQDKQTGKSKTYISRRNSALESLLNAIGEHKVVLFG